MAASISVIIPTLNEAERIASTIRRVKTHGAAEIIVADGGSADGTAEIAASLGVTVLAGAANRGAQQNLGALRAAGSILLFLHADTELPVDFAGRIRRTLAIPGVAGEPSAFVLTVRDGNCASSNASWRCVAGFFNSLTAIRRFSSRKKCSSGQGGFLKIRSWKTSISSPVSRNSAGWPSPKPTRSLPHGVGAGSGSGA